MRLRSAGQAASEMRWRSSARGRSRALHASDRTAAVAGFRRRSLARARRRDIARIARARIRVSRGRRRRPVAAGVQRSRFILVGGR
eukprot:31194-Pelagococcus_subviridis.AAC.23